MDILNALKKTTESIRDWTGNKLDNKVDKVAGKSLSTNDYTISDKQAVSSIATGLTLLDGKLYLSKNGELLSSGVTLPSGGGGGGSSSDAITLKNELESTTITAAINGDVLLKFNYASTEDDNGTAYVYINDVLKLTTSIVTGSNTINIGGLVGEGISSVKLTCMDQYSNSKSLLFTTNIISLKVTSTFDDSKIFDGDVVIRYLPYGATSKDVHLLIDSQDYIISTTSETGKQQTYTIDGSTLSHGVHDLVLYLTAEINGVKIISNKLYYSIVKTEQDATTPIISSVCTTETLTQGEQLQINYLCYDPSNMETEVSLIVYSNGEIYSESKRTVGATKQIWSIRDLPVGEVTLKIAYGIVERTHIVTVLENNINISVKQTDLEFELKAEGKSNNDNNHDMWENNGVSTVFENINYESSGWIDTADGTSLRLIGNAKATIQFQPFASDARNNGQTIEFSFAIRDVNNRNAVAINCFDGSIGFTVTADTAKFMSEQTSVSCNYTDEEKVHVAFVVEGKNEYRMISVYLNGILSGVKQYPETDNFQQNGTPKYIEIGSPYCSIDLFSIRCYNVALTSSEIRDNYIADITDITKKLSLIEDNDVYDIYGSLSFDKLKDKIPVVLITGDLPTYKGDKKKVSISFTHPDKPILNYEDASVTIDVQGTSSQFYPRKNYKLKESAYHMIDTDKIDTKVICIKVDYAESTGCRNVSGANYVHTLYMDAKIPPQEVDDRVRSTIYGYPCLVFHRSNTSAAPEFISKGNYNYDKGSSEAFGFTDEYPDAFSVEFCNNTSDACLFRGEMPESWGDDFEYRHPDGYDNIEDSGFKRMHSWVVSTRQDMATGNALDSTYTGVDGTTYTNDTAEYRLAKFKKEFTDYFDMDFALVYYTYGIFGMYVDSFAKNLFLTTFDRQHWYCYYYDLDTSYGINNEGVLQFSYDHLFDDKLGNAFIFNGQSSTLWQNFEQAFIDEVKATYKEWRSNGLLTYDKIIEYFIDKQTTKYGISVYNEDSEVKYIEMLRSDGDATNLYQVRGDGAEHLKYFVKNRIKFYDSYCNAGDYPNDYVSLRIYTPLSDDLVVDPNANITVTPFSGMICGLKYKANGTLQQQRAEAGIPVTFIAPNETFNDTETAIYGASELSSLGDLSPLYPGTVNLSKATKLTEVIIGCGKSGYVNTNLRDLSVGTNKLLKKIDVQNCPNLTNPLALSDCPNIEEIYATGSGITSVELPSSGYLKKVYLPNTLTNLTVTNQQYIEEFYLEGYDNLTTLRIEKTVNIPVEDIMLNAPNLNRIRLIDVTWEAESEAALVQTIEKFKSCLGLDASGNNTDKAVVTGYVKVAETVSDEVLGDIYNNFPDLVVDDGSSNIYIINYKDWDGTVLYTARLANGANAIDPVSEGLISVPSRPATEDYKYEFIGWNNIPTNVDRHYVITAQYHTLYAIKFYVDDQIVYTQWAIQGDSAVDPVENGDIEAPTKEGTDDLHYIFSGWDNLPTNVQNATSAYAQFSNVYPVRFYTTSDTSVIYHTQWVIEGEDAHEPIIAGECEVPSEIIESADKKYVFVAWDNIPTNVNSITSVYATYDTYWAVRFYNETVVVDLQWVRNGGSGENPISRDVNPIETPTKESTAQYDFRFSSWDGDYTNVTEAINIYAVYSSTIRKYTVYFYNMDELLYTVENVQYGSGATYSGATPTKLGVDNPEEYEFTGWGPAPENIKGDTKCYALFRFTGYLEDDWSTIAANVENGTAVDLYPIGARKEVSIALSDGSTITADVELIEYNHDNLADDSGKATLTFFCKNLPDLYQKMDDANDDGYAASDMRTFLNGELFDGLPSDLQAVIKPVYKISDGGKNNKALVTTTDKCWLASYNEIGFVDGISNLTGQGELYASTFILGDSGRSSRVKYLPDGHTSYGWWTRTSYYSANSVIYYRVTNSGGSYCDIPSNLYGVAFGFCI